MDCRYNLLEMYKKGQRVTFTCLFDVVVEYPDGMSNREVGNIFGVSPQAIDIVAQKAMNKMREAAPHLEEHLEPDLPTFWEDGGVYPLRYAKWKETRIKPSELTMIPARPRPTHITTSPKLRAILKKRKQRGLMPSEK
jgi:hypothetical protein